MTQPRVVASKNDFLLRLKSVIAPISGALNKTMALATAMVIVHNKVALPVSRSWAMTPTKKVLNTAVSTTVVYPELAKSNIAQANFSRFLIMIT